MERAQARRSKQKKTRVIAAVVILALVAAGAAYLLAPSARRGGEGAQVTTPSGLKYTDVVVGDGPSPRPGQTVAVHYTGTLTNGTEFDSSRRRGQPYSFVFGQTPMIKGWDEGLSTMKVGGRRQLVVPPALGYGAAGRPPQIPGGSTLLFDLELLDVK
jgi:peptidylprolyl isomerase